MEVSKSDTRTATPDASEDAWLNKKWKNRVQNGAQRRVQNGVQRRCSPRVGTELRPDEAPRQEWYEINPPGLQSAEPKAENQGGLEARGSRCLGQLSPPDAVRLPQPARLQAPAISTPCPRVLRPGPEMMSGPGVFVNSVSSKNRVLRQLNADRTASRGHAWPVVTH